MALDDAWDFLKADHCSHKGTLTPNYETEQWTCNDCGNTFGFSHGGRIDYTQDPNATERYREKLDKPDYTPDPTTGYIQEGKQEYSQRDTASTCRNCGHRLQGTVCINCGSNRTGVTGEGQRQSKLEEF